MTRNAALVALALLLVSSAASATLADDWLGWFRFFPTGEAPAPLRPNLAISFAGPSEQHSRNYRSGEEMKFDVEVRNSEKDRTVGEFRDEVTVQVRLSPTISSVETTHLSLSPGGKARVVVRIPDGASVEKDTAFYPVAIVDPYNTIREENETDNSYQLPKLVVAGAKATGEPVRPQVKLLGRFGGFTQYSVSTVVGASESRDAILAIEVRKGTLVLASFLRKGHLMADEPYMVKATFWSPSGGDTLVITTFGENGEKLGGVVLLLP